MDLNLLEKTELRIDGITTDGTNLTDLAHAVATTLELPDDKVMVIDLRPGQLALDILARSVRAEALFGRQAEVLAALAGVPGVTLAPDAAIHSEGILGAIALDKDEAAQAIETSREMGRTVASSRKARVRVYPTGFELVEGRIADTNTPYLVKQLEQAGYLAEAGGPLPDQQAGLSQALAEAAATHGLIVTTGGVGAEDKDFSVEAILALDPQAATPYLVRFQKGEGRHVKDGVRIGVGEYQGCLIAALPGPHDEVRLAAPVLVEAYKRNRSKGEMANALAEAIRGKFLAHNRHPHAHPNPGETS
jgi:molybdenum cofactor synthesis domain-containing protein